MTRIPFDPYLVGTQTALARIDETVILVVPNENTRQDMIHFWGVPEDRVEVEG